VPNLTVSQAAARLGLSRCRIRQLIAAGRLKAEHFGHQWLIHEEDLADLKRGPVGRPPLVRLGPGGDYCRDWPCQDKLNAPRIDDLPPEAPTDGQAPDVVPQAAPCADLPSQEVPQ
jgi:excisionase family DNA binding protein